MNTATIIKNIKRILCMDPQFVFGETKNIADAVLFVSGEEGSFINGASLVVDGGMSCN